LNLAWLLNLVYQPLLDPGDPVRNWAVVAGVVAVFLPIYLGATAGAEPLRRRAPVLISGLAVLAMPFNVGASVLLVYAAAFVGADRSRAVAVRWFAGMTALLLAAGALSAVTQPWALLGLAPTLVLVWAIGLIVAEGTERDRADRFRNAQVEHLATLTERERISRDLHDLLGQTLTGIVVRSQLAQRLARSDADAGIAEMAEVERAARAALSEVRATVSGWRHVDLDVELDVARHALAAAGVALTVVRDPDLPLTPSTETALGLALRESVTNVVRHAHAARCAVAIRRAGGRVVLEVTDDGVGGELRDGNGLTGMRERIAALGGDVDRQVRDGTAVTVAVPG
jgi:two-component system sensor histidine kinase DesK